ncbi:hypothetical protein BHM03_00022934 [Ensete ventricosum]|nr:hypothetical protein BHM03_00022934 [Ensete ventricosum]
MTPSFGRFGMATNIPSSAYKLLHEYRILRVSNSPHLCEFCATLSVIVQHIPLCTVSSFTKCPACLEHHQVSLPMSSRSSNLGHPNLCALHILPSLFVLAMPLVQRVGHSFE